MGHTSAYLLNHETFEKHPESIMSDIAIDRWIYHSTVAECRLV